MECLEMGTTLPEAYHAALCTLHDYGGEVNCSDWNTKCIELPMTFEVYNPLKEPMISKCFIGGQKELQQYVMEMLDGILDFEVEKGNWAYTYHQRMGEQVQFVIDELKRNPSSRRAVIGIRDKSDIGSNEPACLQHIQYLIHNGELDCYVLFRSNDAVKATFMNAFALIMLQKKIADELGIKVGTYTHRANSFHCYAKDYALLNGYVNRYEANEDLTYEYDGDWKEEMDSYIPEILEAVDKLKKI